MTDNEAQQQLAEHRRIWHWKPVLQRVYKDQFFSRLISFRQTGGISVEVGAGPGFLKEVLPDLVSTDLTWCPWLDTVADAQYLPFKNNSVANLLGLDVLHHLSTPMALLKEAERVLIPGGRLILVEPWVTPFSYVVYRYLHQEDCDLNARPLVGDAISLGGRKKAFDGNQAVPYLLFRSRALSSTLAAIPSLRPIVIEPFCLFAYLASLGFKRISLLPVFLYPLIAKLEQITMPLWRSFAALRVLLVLEKQKY